MTDMRSLIAISLIGPLAGCSALMGTVGNRENITCHDYAYTALLDVAIASLIGGISYAKDGGTGGQVAAGVFGGSAVIGFTASLVCDARREAKETPAVYYPRGNPTPPESLRLDPNSSEIPDATPEEMGLVRTPTTSPDLAVHADPPVGATTSPPPVSPAPTCQLSPRIECPQKTHCVLTEENHGVCEPI